jgi:hypothetical protein
MSVIRKPRREPKPADFATALELLASALWHLRASTDVRLINSKHGLIVLVPGAVQKDGLPVVANLALNTVASNGMPTPDPITPEPDSEENTNLS